MTTTIIPESARELRKHLDTKVVGQGDAKSALSELLAIHLSYFRQPDPLHPAPNALIIGPTGVGKTHTVETAAEVLEVPIVVLDASRLTTFMPNGGVTFEEVFTDLYHSANRLVNAKEEQLRVEPLGLAERGIVFIDEFDKLATKTARTDESYTVQRRLLQILEGTSVTLKIEDKGQPLILSTAGVLFVCSGAFPNIESDETRSARPAIIKRLYSNAQAVLSCDVAYQGFLKELVARMPVLIRFEHLGEDDLFEILRNPEVDPSTVYSRYFQGRGIPLELTTDAMRAIARQAAMLEMGARGLHQILFAILSRRSMEIDIAGNHAPGQLVIDEDEVRRLIALGF